MNETNEEICPICLDTISSSKATISCGHTFCTECLLLSSLNNKNCPMCRKDIYSDSNKKIYDEQKENNSQPSSNSISLENIQHIYTIYESYYRSIAEIFPPRRHSQPPPQPYSQRQLPPDVLDTPRSEESSDNDTDNDTLVITPRPLIQKRKRRCSLCNEEGHIRSNRKFHPTIPN